MNDHGTGYEFTNTWFDDMARPVWTHLIPQLKPQKVLEIGSFEGVSAIFVIEANDWCDRLDIWCVDTWEGGVEHRLDQVNMTDVEQRFDRNIAIARAGARRATSLTKVKGFSDIALPKLLAEGHAGTFDFVYVDGSHLAPDVLIDAVLAFKLCRVGGVIAFDDYLWAADPQNGRDPTRAPKMAIDAFTNIYFGKVQIMRAPLYQVYVHKMTD